MRYVPGLTHAKLKGADRTDRVVAKRLNGATLDAIAKAEGVSRERIRQLLRETYGRQMMA